MRILLVEDDPKMSLVLRDALEKKLHRIVIASTGDDGLEMARSFQFESIILDAMLPGMGLRRPPTRTMHGVYRLSFLSSIRMMN